MIAYRYTSYSAIFSNTQCDKTRKAIENSVAYKIAVGNDSFRDLWGAQRHVTDKLRERPCYRVVKAPTG